MNRRAPVALALAVCVFLPAAFGSSDAAFTAAAANPGNSVSSAADWTPPTAAAAIVVRQGSTVPGAIAPGATYFVYASVSDTGNPASGVAAVDADLSALTAGAGSTALSAGSWTIAGASYNYRAGPLVADSSAAAGAASFSLQLSDAAGNSTTTSGFGATVDTTPPAASDVQAAGGGPTPGRLEAADTLSLTFSEQIDPASVSPGWDGTSSLPAVVHLTRGTAGSNDTVTFFDARDATQLPLGSVDLGRNDYTTSNVTFGAAGTPSIITQQLVTVGGTTVTQLTITLGSASASLKTARGSGTMVWQPVAGVLDPAGNPMSTSAATESGPLDVDF